MLDIDARAVVAHTNTLEKMHRSALPHAVRNALNGTAFSLKKNEMPAQASREFIQRMPNFFKATSRVQMARGWDIAAMESTVGFVGKGQAVEDLQQQEYGGEIQSRSFIPMEQARVSGQRTKVKPSNRLSRIKKIYKASTMDGNSPKAKFYNAVNKAGKGGYVLGNNAKQTVFKVESVRPLKLKPVYSYKKDRDVRVKATSFMRTASLESQKLMESIYIREAERQIARLKK